MGGGGGYHPTPSRAEPSRQGDGVHLWAASGGRRSGGQESRVRGQRTPSTGGRCPSVSRARRRTERPAARSGSPPGPTTAWETSGGQTEKHRQSRDVTTGRHCAEDGAGWRTGYIRGTEGAGRRTELGGGRGTSEVLRAQGGGRSWVEDGVHQRYSGRRETRHNPEPIGISPIDCSRFLLTFRKGT